MKILVDRQKALQLLQKVMVEEFPETWKGNKPSKMLLDVIWRNSLNCPAYAIPQVKAIYIKDVPEEFLPLVLNHEELHILIYQILKEDLKNSKKAAQASQVVDSLILYRWLCELFGIDYENFMRFLTFYPINTFQENLDKLLKNLKSLTEKIIMR